MFICKWSVGGSLGILSVLCSMLGGAFAGAPPVKKPAAKPQIPMAKPQIAITSMPTVPPGETSWGTITGTVRGVDARACHVIVYARGDTWYVQPWANSYQTEIDASTGKWATGTHGAWAFAALIVRGDFSAPATMESLPPVGGPILAIARGTPKQ